MESCIRFSSVRTWMIDKTMVREILVWLVIRMLGIPRQIEINVFPHIWTYICIYVFFFGTTAPPVSQGLLFLEVSRLHSMMQHGR
jgi:hypothetical protein